jgi:hypothetical protein
MMYLDLTLEDTRIRAEYVDESWSCCITDTMKGQEQWESWSNTQMAAVIALAIGGDETPFATACYEIAEGAVSELPNELRPIP